MTYADIAWRAIVRDSEVEEDVTTALAALSDASRTAAAAAAAATTAAAEAAAAKSVVEAAVCGRLRAVAEGLTHACRGLAKLMITR